jgi:hypothetical protein
MTSSATCPSGVGAVNASSFPVPPWQKACLSLDGLSPSLDGLSPSLDGLNPSRKRGWLALEAPLPSREMGWGEGG